MKFTKISNSLISKAQFESYLKNIFILGRKPYFWILFATILLYLPTITFNFYPQDDEALILNKMDWLANPKNIFEFLSTPTFGVLYRPILTLSLSLDAILGGNSPILFNLTNLLLHCIFSVLLFQFLVIIKTKRVTSFFIALLFAFHPINNGAVVWIPGRNDILLAIFCLSSFIFFIKFIQSNNLIHGIVCSLLYFLALLTKENAIVLPFLFLAYYLILNCKINTKSLFGFFGIIGVTSIIWKAIHSSVVPSVNILDYFVSNVNYVTVSRFFSSILISLSKIVLLLNLQAFPTDETISIIPGVFTLLFLLALILILKIKENTCFPIFGVIWFFAFITIPMIFSSLENSFQYEHRLYLPCIGILIIFSQVSLINSIRAIYKYIFIFVLMVFVVISQHRFDVFNNPIQYYSLKIENFPQDYTSYNLRAHTYQWLGEYELAILDFTKLLESSIQPYKIYNNRGLCYEKIGDYHNALVDYQTANALLPNNKVILLNIEIIENMIKSNE